MQQHIPAWKRIGLKLKYAKDSPDPPYQNAEAEINRTSNGDHELSETANLDDVRPPKKRKLSADVATGHRTEVARTVQTQPSTTDALHNVTDAQEVESKKAEQPGWQESSEADKQDYSTPAEDTRPAQQSRRKSVTFTPETKQEDGFSASNFSKKWFQSQSLDQSQPVSTQNKSAPNESEERPKKSKKRSQDVGIVHSSIPNQDTTSDSTSLEIESSLSQRDESQRTSPERSEPAGETKASKKKKQKDKSSEPKTIPSCIEYLQHFSQDRGAWRFNKHKQTILLKNLFDVHLIPAQHDEAIIEYISGLQGAAAQQRIIETATSILNTIAEKQDDFDMQSMESEEARRRAYADALKKEITRYERSKLELNDHDEQQLAEMKYEIERGRRAEAVLFSLLQKELHPERVAYAKPASQQQTTSSHSNEHNKREVSVPKATNSSHAASLKRKGDISIATKGSPATGLKRKKRKIRVATAEGDSSSSSSESDNDNRSTPSSGPKTLREALTITADLDNLIPVKKSQKLSATGKGKQTFFSDDLLDKTFPQEKTYHEVAPKRKATMDKGRGFHYTHGALADESGSESD